MRFKWDSNKAYESKHTIKDTLLISNRNNVKGLEYPFVICVTKGFVSKCSIPKFSLYDAYSFVLEVIFVDIR